MIIMIKQTVKILVFRLFMINISKIIMDGCDLSSGTKLTYIECSA